MEGFTDLGALSEDKRIEILGEYAMAGKRVGFVVDADLDNYDKADRYIAKLKALHPTINIIQKKIDSPFPGVTTIIIGPPSSE